MPRSSKRPTQVVLSEEGEVRERLPDGSLVPVEDRTDWTRVDTALAEQEEAERDDPDFWERAVLLYPKTKERITLRLDAEVLDWFRAEGRGYQTRINAVLRAYVEAKRRRA